MISYNEAIGIIINEGGKFSPGSENIDVHDIAGRVISAPVISAVANPPFDNSAMDGFALKAEELGNATIGSPVALAIAGHIAAGDTRRFNPPGPGRCYEIMTGAAMPPGCDAVVPLEKIEKSSDGKIVFRATPDQGENIRCAGADYKAGDIVFDQGMEMAPSHVLALATLGIGTVAVVRKTKIALISTGNEIVDLLGASLEYGQIYNSTKPYLRAALAEPGLVVDDAGTMRDDPAAFAIKLQALLDGKCDLIISTGAVSAGVHDFVPGVLASLGAEIFFHKVAIRPGKPLLFAKFPHGAFYAGLPGNPAASAAGLRFFVQPLLRAMRGLPPEEKKYAVLQSDYHKGDLPLRFFMRARKTWNDKGVCELNIPQKQQSFMVSPFADSNCWAVIPEDVSMLKTGDLVEVCY